jgi:hypothetical protein
MNETKERRQLERQTADGIAVIAFGQDSVSCRVIDVSVNGAQVRIDGRRASRNLMGKRVELSLNVPGLPADLPGRVVWVRPAVNGVYLGIERDRPDARNAEPLPEGHSEE